MTIRFLTINDTKSFNNYIQDNKHGLLYYSLKYKEFLENLLHSKSHYVISEDSQGINGILPLMSYEGKFGRVINSLPFYGSQGGALGKTQDIEKQLYEFAYNTILKDSAAYTIVTHPFKQSDVFPLEYNYTDERIGQWTRLQTGNDELQSIIDSTARRNIRKSIKSSIMVDIDNSQNAMEFMRSAHIENMKRIGGKEKSDSFFSLIPSYFEENIDYDIYTAKLDNDYVAALLVFYYGNVVEYFTPVTGDTYKSMQPMALIIYTAMLNLYQKGFRWWNWGGTWESQEGVYKFKKKWGAEEFVYKYYTSVNNNQLLQASTQKLLSEYPDFYVLPFKELSQ